jgi:hypothetical protein
VPLDDVSMETFGRGANNNGTEPVDNVLPNIIDMYKK